MRTPEESIPDFSPLPVRTGALGLICPLPRPRNRRNLVCHDSLCAFVSQFLRYLRYPTGASRLQDLERWPKFATRDVFGRIGTTSGDDFQAASITIRKEVAVVAYAREEHSRSERAISLPRSEASRQKVRSRVSTRSTFPWSFADDRTSEPRNVPFRRSAFCSFEASSSFRRHRASKSILRSVSPRRVLSLCHGSKTIRR